MTDDEIKREIARRLIEKAQGYIGQPLTTYMVEVLKNETLCVLTDLSHQNPVLNSLELKVTVEDGTLRCSMEAKPGLSLSDWWEAYDFLHPEGYPNDSQSASKS